MFRQLLLPHSPDGIPNALLSPSTGFCLHSVSCAIYNLYLVCARHMLVGLQRLVISMRAVCMLYRLANDGYVEVRVDGPYGEDFERPKWGSHEVLVIFAGGIGVGPCLLALTIMLCMSFFCLKHVTRYFADPEPCISLLPGWRPMLTKSSPKLEPASK